MIGRLAFRALGAVALAAAAPLPPPATLTVADGRFVLATGTQQLGSAQLVGASLLVPVAGGNGGGMVAVRIDGLSRAVEAPSVWLHMLSIANHGGGRASYCTADATGRSAAIAMAGWLDAGGRFVADADRFFLACTSGAVGKCVLWGYDPWRLPRHYEACLRAVRADYDGDGVAHTRDGTLIDLADDAGVQRWASVGDPESVFEAGWGPRGAICVARVRWPDLYAQPLRATACDRQRASAAGALLFTRIKQQPAAH